MLVAMGRGRTPSPRIVLVAGVVLAACATPPLPVARPAPEAEPAPPSRDIGWYGPAGAPVVAERRRGEATELPTNQRSRLGVSLGPVGPHAADWPFADAFRSAGPWLSRSASGWDDGRPVARDADGWVESLQSGQSAAALVPTREGGLHLLSWMGRGRVEVGGARVLESPGPRERVLDLPAHTHVVVELFEVDPADPIRELRLVSRTATAGAAFHPRFVEGLSPFSVLRFCGWGQVESATAVRWADRPRRLAATQSGPDGVAYEWMIDLANRAGADPWICVPAAADDAYVDALAALLHDRLDPARGVILEYGHELWSDAPEATAAAWLAAQAARRVKPGLELTAARLDAQAERSAAVFERVGRLLAGRRRLVRVVGSRLGDVAAHRRLLEHPALRGKVDALAVDAFYGREWSEQALGLELAEKGTTAMLDRLEAEGLPRVITAVGQSARVARELGVPLFAYAGGAHLVAHPSLADDPTVTERMDEASRSPWHRRLLARLLDAWRDAGGDLFVLERYAQTPGRWGRFGLLERQDQAWADAPRYAAAIDWIRRHPR